MSPEEFRLQGHALIDWVADFLAQSRELPVLARTAPGELTDALPLSAPEGAESFDQIFADFRKEIVPRITQWNHPGFMGYFANSSVPPAILAELLAAALNSNAMLWKASPAATELEEVTLSWLRQWLGLADPWFGQIFDTASISSFHAIVAARERVQAAGASELVLYASIKAHSSIPKAAFAAGIARQNVRLIAVDEQFRMRPEALAEAIEADLAAGRTPFCVVATAGTTSVASVDPVAAILLIAQRHDLWLHVDAAYGGSAAIHEQYRWLMEGVAGADSFVINPHKWLFVPMDLSVLYVRNRAWLSRAFSLVPEFLRTEQDPRALNLNEYGLPLGRRFRSLKLWFVMRCYGRQHLAAVIHRHIEDAKRLALCIDAHPDFEVAAPVYLSLIVFRHKGGDAINRALLETVNASGRVLLSPDVLDSKQVIRLAVGNYGSVWEDLEIAWGLIQEAAREQKT